MAATDEIRELSDKDLTHRLFRVERELVKARFDHSMQQLENTAVLRGMRRTIARIKTEARRRELEKGMDKDSLIRTHRGSFKTDEVAADTGDDDASGGFLQGIVDKLSGNE